MRCAIIPFKVSQKCADCSVSHEGDGLICGVISCLCIGGLCVLGFVFKRFMTLPVCIILYSFFFLIWSCCETNVLAIICICKCNNK